MKQSAKVIALLTIFSLTAFLTLKIEAQERQNLSYLAIENEKAETAVDSTLDLPRDLSQLLSALDTIQVKTLDFNKLLGPRIFTGYRHIPVSKKIEVNPDLDYLSLPYKALPDSVTLGIDESGEIIYIGPSGTPVIMDKELIEKEVLPSNNHSVLKGSYVPEWLIDAVKQIRMQDDLMYSRMIVRPKSIDYAYWDLPEPPVLPDDEVTFEAYIRKLDLPEIETGKAILPEGEIRKIHWLHNVNAYAQFSQAFVSKNWYQGGNNHLALLMGANWNVQLNQVYHPNILFQSNLSYKLGLYSSPEDQVHKYSISEDVLQWNLNTGLKALKKWYYSFNAQFKTQIFNYYPTNSDQLKASFLSPGDFNMGLGMAFSHKKPNIEFTATISPFSYNLKTCISDRIDHLQFKIPEDRKTHSDFGSNAEFNMNWKVRYNINYKTRLFLFSDYNYFLSDWEHTFNFEFNKFLSTQIYVHMRLDTSSDLYKNWRHFMLREVLSFGLSYTFSTK